MNWSGHYYNYVWVYFIKPHQPVHKAGHDHCHATHTNNQGVLLKKNYTEASIVYPFQASMHIALDIPYMNI